MVSAEAEGCIRTTLARTYAVFTRERWKRKSLSWQHYPLTTVRSWEIALNIPNTLNTLYLAPQHSQGLFYAISCRDLLPVPLLPRRRLGRFVPNLVNEDGMKFAPRNVLYNDDPLPTAPVGAIPVLVAVNGRSMAGSI